LALTILKALVSGIFIGRAAFVFRYMRTNLQEALPSGR